MPKRSLSRRDFLKTTGTAAATVAAASVSAKSYGRILGASDRLNVGMIGCGGMAGGHLGSLLDMAESDNCQVLAVCDCWATRARSFQDRVRDAGGDAEVYVDYQELLARDDIDVVNIATPEHWHAQQTIDALDAGKHVYCEKPMTHKAHEARGVVAKVRETGLKMQVGVQGMSDDSYISARHAIEEGILGPVIHAQIDYVRNYPADAGPWRTGIASDAPKPDDLDWERWLGPAPQLPWDARRYHDWRCYRDYSGGVATDLFVHRITRIMKACNLQYPTKVVGMGGIYVWPDGRDLPDNFEMICEYGPIEGITPGMTVHVLGTMANQRGIEHMIRGHNASLIFTGGGWQVIEERTGNVLATHQKTGGEDITLHHRNHFAAIRDGAELNCPPELGEAAVVAVDLANESWFRGKLLGFEPERYEIVEL